MVGIEQMVSAESWGGSDESWASAWAALVGEAGCKWAESSSPASKRRFFLMASA